jgi:cytochrome c553
VDAAKAADGKKVADAALCTMCHLGGFSGQNEVPRVAGQEYDYIVKQLKDFRAKNRTNDAGNMTSVSRGLTDEQIDALGNYITGLQ